MTSAHDGARGGERVRLEPAVGAESEAFWEATCTKNLLIQWCTICDRAIFYPRSFCPYCARASGPSGLEWRRSSGNGRVYAMTIEANPAAAGAAFSGGAPYVVALVELTEGVRMMSNIVDCDPGDVVIGMEVQVAWEPLSDGRHLPLFQPVTQ